MKRLFALILGLVLVLGFGSAAGAVDLDLGVVDMEISGRLTLQLFDYYGDPGGSSIDYLDLDDDYTWVQLKLASELGRFRLWLTPTLDAEGEFYLGGGVMYRASDALSLGIVQLGHEDSEGIYYVSPVDPDYEWEEDGTFLKAELRLDGFQADLFAYGESGAGSESVDVFGGLQWTAGAFTFYLPFEYDYNSAPGFYISRYTDIIMAARYALTDRWYLAAEYRYSNYYYEASGWPVDAWVQNQVAMGAGYQAGVFTVYGHLDYNLTYDDFIWGLGCGWAFNDFAKVQLFYDGSRVGWNNIEALLILTLD